MPIPATTYGGRRKELASLLVAGSAVPFYAAPLFAGLPAERNGLLFPRDINPALTYFVYIKFAADNPPVALTIQTLLDTTETLPGNFFLPGEPIDEFASIGVFGARPDGTGTNELILGAV